MAQIESWSRKEGRKESYLRQKVDRGIKKKNKIWTHKELNFQPSELIKRKTLKKSYSKYLCRRLK